mmetsp:Transcript_102711/g.299629  ORF Transcript_102711/g.299629 Transcript_102711/m.299629 type:complete len:92 (-) Transcript_102711:468-743(-)
MTCGLCPYWWWLTSCMGCPGPVSLAVKWGEGQHLNIVPPRQVTMGNSPFLETMLPCCCRVNRLLRPLTARMCSKTAQRKSSLDTRRPRKHP